MLKAMIKYRRKEDYSNSVEQNFVLKEGTRVFRQDKYQVAIIYNVPGAGYGRYFVYKFPNGYTALVLKNNTTYYNMRWYYILEFQNESGATFTYPNYCGLIKTPGKLLDEEDVAEALFFIEKLPRSM